MLIIHLKEIQEKEKPLRRKLPKTPGFKPAPRIEGSGGGGVNFGWTLVRPVKPSLPSSSIYSNLVNALF